MKRLAAISITVGYLLISKPVFASFEIRQKIELGIEDTLPTKVFGFSQKEVVSFDGDPNGTACSETHKQNDLSNRWCHALFVKMTDKKLKELRMPKIFSALASASIFVPKEFLLDKNPSMADLMIAEFNIYELDQNRGNLSVSLFGDGATIISFEKSF